MQMHMRKQWCAGSYTDLMVNQFDFRAASEKCLSAARLVRRQRRVSEGPIAEFAGENALAVRAFASHNETARSVNETRMYRRGCGSSHSPQVSVFGAETCTAPRRFDWRIRHRSLRDIVQPQRRAAIRSRR